MLGLARLAIVALTLLPSACASPEGNRAATSQADVVEVTCRKDGTARISPSKVTAAPDGVHVVVDNRTGEYVSLVDLVVETEDAQATLVSQAAPGKVDVGCWLHSLHQGGGNPATLPLRVEDPAGLWKDPALECAPDDTIGDITSDFFGNAEGDQRSPEEIVRGMKGVRASDVVERAGYPDAAEPRTRVVRDRKTVALAGFQATEDGGVQMGMFESCSAAKIFG